MIFLKIFTVIISPFLLLGACWLGGKLGIERARRNKKTGCKTPELRKKTPPPPIFISSFGGAKTPYDEKIAEAARELSGEEKPAYLPQLYTIEGVDLAEAEPEQWPKENPFLNLKLLPEIPEIEETDDIKNFVGQALRVERQTREAADALAALAYACEALQPIIEMIAETLPPIIETIADVMAQIIELYPNKRVVHLAKHARKERVRKKNIKRIIEWYARGGR